jgi:hypothetical protein
MLFTEYLCLELRQIMPTLCLKENENVPFDKSTVINIINDRILNSILTLVNISPVMISVM